MRFLRTLPCAVGLCGVAAAACSIPDLEPVPVEGNAASGGAAAGNGGAAGSGAGGGAGATVACQPVEPACGPSAQAPIYYSTFNNPAEITTPTIGNPGATSPAATFFADGKCEQAFNATALNEVVRVSEQGNINYSTGALWLWFRPAGEVAGSVRRLVETGGFNDSGGLSMSLDGTELKLVLRGPKGTKAEVTARAILPSWPAGTWHHIAVTWNANPSGPLLHAYIDGCELAYANNPHADVPRRTLNDDRLQIGGTFGSPDYANGLIDDVQIFGSEVYPKP